MAVVASLGVGLGLGTSDANLAYGQDPQPKSAVKKKTAKTGKKGTAKPAACRARRRRAPRPTAP